MQCFIFMKKEEKDINFRKRAIKELIKNNTIENQDELTSLLKDKYNIIVNQSIVSRDLKNMKILKNLINGKMVYELNEIDPNKEIMRLAVLEILKNESLIVVKTLNGLADFVGDFIDNNFNKIIGTVAGENTVLAIPSSIKDIDKIYRQLCDVLFFKKN
jgi:transcriptional regulator of arginine metabolism